MSSTSVQTDNAGRQVAPLGSPAPFETRLITPVPLVWAPKHMVFMSDEWRTIELPELYVEEMFISEQAVVDEAIQALLQIAPWRTTQCFIDGLPVAMPEGVDDEQQVCRPQLAVSTTLLFDAAALTGNDDEITLRDTICLEDVPAQVARPVKEAPLPYSPALDVFDADNLMVYPTPATSSVYDNLSQMLDFDACDNKKFEETASECAPTRFGRSLTRSPPVFSDEKRDEPQANEIQEVNKQDNISNGNFMPDTLNDPRPWESGCDRVLPQITGQAFLLGIEHLTNIEARSTFITYDSDIQALQQATAAFVDDRNDGECLCLDNKVGSLVLPGENFLLAENNTDVGLSMQHPTAESLFSLIDELVDGKALVEDLAQTPLCPSPSEYDLSQADEDAPRPGALFDTTSSQYTGYTALGQLFTPSDEMSRAVGAHFDDADDVSEISDEDVDELSTFQAFVSSSNGTDEISMSHPSELTYFDADSRQAVAYTAFNQLLLDLNDDETMTRIHRFYDEYDDEDDVSSNDILEIGELPLHSTPSPAGNDFAGFDFDFSSNTISYQPDTIAVAQDSTRFANELLSHSSSPQRRRSRRRPALWVTTELNNIDEDSPDQTQPPSRSSSQDSMDFGDRRGFVQQLPTRRTDFLDDGDSDDDLGVSQSATSPDSSDSGSSCATPTAHGSEYVSELFNEPIWQGEADFDLTFPVTPPAPYSPLPPADGPPDADILNAVEVEVLGLIAYMFDCMHGDRFFELQDLGSDLQWAMTAITDVYPSLGLLKHLGTAVEILLGRCAALSNR